MALGVAAAVACLPHSRGQAADAFGLPWCQNALQGIAAATGATVAGPDGPHADIVALKHPAARLVALFCTAHLGFSLAARSPGAPSEAFYALLAKAAAIVVGQSVAALTSDARSCTAGLPAPANTKGTFKVTSAGPEVVYCAAFPDGSAMFTVEAQYMFGFLSLPK